MSVLEILIPVLHIAILFLRLSPKLENSSIYLVYRWYQVICLLLCIKFDYFICFRFRDMKCRKFHTHIHWHTYTQFPKNIVLNSEHFEAYKSGKILTSKFLTEYNQGSIQVFVSTVRFFVNFTYNFLKKKYLFEKKFFIFVKNVFFSCEKDCEKKI